MSKFNTSTIQKTNDLASNHQIFYISMNVHFQSSKHVTKYPSQSLRQNTNFVVLLLNPFNIFVLFHIMKTSMDLCPFKCIPTSPNALMQLTSSITITLSDLLLIELGLKTTSKVISFVILVIIFTPIMILNTNTCNKKLIGFYIQD